MMEYVKTANTVSSSQQSRHTQIAQLAARLSHRPVRLPKSFLEPFTNSQHVHLGALFMSLCFMMFEFVSVKSRLTKDPAKIS